MRKNRKYRLAPLYTRGLLEEQFFMARNNEEAMDKARGIVLREHLLETVNKDGYKPVSTLDGKQYRLPKITASE